jgi:YbgC/YbaW family acyl-CoA thioester hydrolase
MSGIVATDLPDPAAIVMRRRISWMDTDAAGIYHWTTAFRLAEDAEAALHTALGIVDATFGATPRLSVAADFRQPLRFNDAVDVELQVEALTRSSVTYSLAIAGPDGPAMEGRIVTCFIDRASGKATPWPDRLRERLGAGGRQDDA